VDFETFWAAWPKKKGRAVAEKAWAKVPTDVHDALMVALDAQKTSDTQFKTYTPHASTWLNQRRWEDEVDSTPRASTRDQRQSAHYTPNKHDGKCTFTHNGRQCPLPGNLLNGPSTAPAPWFCQWHSRATNRGYGPEQDDFFRIYAKAENAADYVQMHYTHDTDALVASIQDDNPQWQRLPSEGQTAYRERMRDECRRLLNAVRDNQRLSNVP